MASSVYCDNDILKDHILNSRPSVDGLFPHELAVISYAAVGQLCAKSTAFSGVFVKELKIKYPVLLLESLVTRGFISIIHSIENLKYHRTYLLQEFAKKRQLKHPNNRELLFDIITQNVSEEVIDAELPLDFYLPSVKGRLALDHAHYDYSDAYLGWSVPSDFFCGSQVREEDIVVLRNNINGINVVTNTSDKWMYYINVDGSIQPIHTAKWSPPKRQEILIYKDNRCVFSAKDVDCVDFFYSQRLIGFRRLNNAPKGHLLPAKITIFDLYNEKKIDEFYEGIHQEEFIELRRKYIEEKTKEGRKVKAENEIHYFVSSSSRIPEYILTEYPTSGKENIKITMLSNYMDDQTRNVDIAVPVHDDMSRNLIQYMIAEGLFRELSVFGIPIREFGDYFFLCDIISTSRSKLRIYSTQESLPKQDSISGHGVLSVLKPLEKQDIGYRNLQRYVWSFPSSMFDYSPYRHYDPWNDHGDDKNWLYVRDHLLQLRQQYNDRVLNLQERGIIPTKWVSEFNLYLLVKDIYPDSIYQYRATWLGQQSIDIFIPSHKIGIEYQGIQHYKPVDLFGGEEGFHQVQKRDSRKRELCRSNGIILLEWHYAMPINKNNVKSFLT